MEPQPSAIESGTATLSDAGRGQCGWLGQVLEPSNSCPSLAAIRATATFMCTPAIPARRHQRGAGPLGNRTVDLRVGRPFCGDGSARSQTPGNARCHHICVRPGRRSATLPNTLALARSPRSTVSFWDAARFCVKFQLRSSRYIAT